MNELNLTISLRVNEQTLEQFKKATYPFRYTDFLRELMLAYVENRVTITNQTEQ